MKLLILGDVHGDFLGINILVQTVKPDAIIQCGDFGYWPNSKRLSTSKQWAQLKKGFGVPLYFCDGNHEEFPALYEIPDGHELCKGNNVFHCRRGKVINLEGTNIMFMGGAASVDRRTYGYDAFVEENITSAEVDKALAYEGDVDIIVSHACPDWFNFHPEWWDSNRVALGMLYNKFEPTKWYFGHYHENYVGWYQDCKFYCLDCIQKPGGYEVLNI